MSNWLVRLVVGFFAVLSIAATALACVALIQQQHINDHVRALQDRATNVRSGHDLLVSLLDAMDPMWIDAEGAPIQVRLRVLSQRVTAGMPVALLAEVRNSSGVEVVVSDSGFAPWDIEVFRDGVRVPYLGAMPGAAPPRAVPIAPGHVMRRILELTVNRYPGLSEPGEFKAKWKYESVAVYKEATWIGEMPAVSATWVAR